jgi:histone H3/H4
MPLSLLHISTHQHINTSTHQHINTHTHTPARRRTHNKKFQSQSHSHKMGKSQKNDVSVIVAAPTVSNNKKKTMKRKTTVHLISASGINGPSLERIARRAGVTHMNKSTSGFRRVKNKSTGVFEKIAVEKEQTVADLMKSRVLSTTKTYQHDAALIARSHGRVTINGQDAKTAINMSASRLGIKLVV